MGLKDGENLNVTCPCCQAKLVVDPVFGAVLSHQAPVKPGPDVDLTKAGSILDEQKRQREDKFADSWFQETNKEDILKALVERYVARATVVFEGMDVESFPAMTLEQSIRTILAPLKEFIRDNRDFQAIFSHPTGVAFVEETIRAMDAAFQARTDAALALARPHLSAKDRRKYSLVCMIIMKGLLGQAHQSSELTLDEVFDELEAVYLRYLTPVIGDE